MISPKSVFVFAAGCMVGIFLAGALMSQRVKASAEIMPAGPFADVPAGHVAAASVASLKKKNIITGYSDNTYRGTQPVTRYEVAIVLARFAQYYDTSKAPLATTQVPIPGSPAWASPSRSYLASNLFIPPTSPTFTKDGNSPVPAGEFADDVSSVIDRITDRSMPLQHP